jgi:hypothetical protein
MQRPGLLFWQSTRMFVPTQDWHGMLTQSWLIEFHLTSLHHITTVKAHADESGQNDVHYTWKHRQRQRWILLDRADTQWQHWEQLYMFPFGTQHIGGLHLKILRARHSFLKDTAALPCTLVCCERPGLETDW